ncbi:MAG TPA: hypothetical protein GX734_04695 [Clostridiaceae bacterium]|nr:hypothetical protein [Clostridiaceae bacterium]
MKHRTRYTLLLVIIATLISLACLFAACANRSPIIGSWTLVESEDPSFTVGMTFEFKENGTLNLLPGTATLINEDIEMFIRLKEEHIALSYQASPNGDLRLTLDKVEGGSDVLRMHYSIEGDMLTIKDEHDTALSFRRQ